MIPRLPASYVKTIVIITCFIITSNACTMVTGVEESNISTPIISQPDWYSVYFTEPTDANATSYRGGIDEALAAAIDQARLSVDVAIYDLNLWSLRDALVNAHRRGVEVRLITDSDNMDETEIQELKEAGIQVLGDRRESLMHDKFAIIDRSEVWTGSLNFTTGGAYLDNNNLLRIQSSKLAEHYRAEFEQMFTESRFGSDKIPSPDDKIITVNESLIEAYFSPQDNTLEHILEAVSAARERIDFLAYSFTSDELSEALIEQARSGVTVRGVFDEDQYYSNAGTELDRLADAGLDVRLDGNERLMHHKVIIIDGETVITGSYNFSRNAEFNNDENTLIIHNQDLANQYLTEFMRIYEIAQR